MKRTIALLLSFTLVLFPIAASSVSAPWGAYRGYPIVQVVVNGREVKLDVPAHVAEGRTLVPLRFVAEALGANVNWDGSKLMVSVNTKEQTSANPDLQAQIARLWENIEQLNRQVEGLQINQQSPVQVVAKVKPSVVGIIATQVFEGAEEIHQGTGVVLSLDGMIVTNTHVVKQRGVETTDIFVVLNDGRALRASLWNYDYLSDIAVVKVEASNLSPANFGDSDKVELGQQVLAIGNPLSLGLRNTVTAGVVSGLNRADQSAYPLIQTDAAINGGNSGGPLVDYAGKVIAITSSKITAPGVEGLGFAIPMNLVKDIISRFTDRGVVRPFIGVVVEESYFAGLGIPSAQGLTVVELAQGGPGETAGLKMLDNLKSINGKPINTLIELRSELERLRPSQQVTLGVKRGLAEVSITIVLGEWATEDASPFEFGAMYPWEAEF